MRTFAAVVVTTIVIAIITYVSSLSAQSPLNRRALPWSAELAAASITATTATGAIGVTNLTTDCVYVSLENTCSVELDAVIGSALTKKRVPANSVRTYDLGSDGSRWTVGTTVGVFRGGSAPSGCSFELFCQPY